ncbi:Uncharacterized protein PECH_000613 [Penicillium ucsense]|uniref:Uncharacterized protein n=1 Tax=Penicillium ucsense TaxID=2839758 RepID=A0A8J8W0B4_9EURO|nr:Uncharacterized protein PECM_000669 [Penicillium ucsense]KAF7738348.1 Uncharacterized protein PECH_000613 [Penicillium ucsense]
MAAFCDQATTQVVCQPSPPQRHSLLNVRRMFSSDESSLDSYYAWSDEKDIYNASVVDASNRNSRQCESDYRMAPVLEEGMAANIAMFIPAPSSNGSPLSTLNRNYQKRGRVPASTLLCRDQALSEQHTGIRVQTAQTTHRAHAHRKAISLDNVPQQRPRNWPGKPGQAIMPNRPQYPAPRRVPTPPGLPSFNTPEACRLASQFLLRESDRAGGTVNHGNNLGRSLNSYGDAIRRFFGWSTTANPQNTSQRYAGIGRADDGTIVHGRLPFRQSGHNVNMARNIHDHPFAQIAPVVAETEVVPTEDFEREKNNVPNRRQQRQDSNIPAGSSSRGASQLCHSTTAPCVLVDQQGRPLSFSESRQASRSVTVNDQAVPSPTTTISRHVAASNSVSLQIDQTAGTDNNTDAGISSANDGKPSVAAGGILIFAKSIFCCLPKKNPARKCGIEAPSLEAAFSHESQQVLRDRA